MIHQLIFASIYKYKLGVNYIWVTWVWKQKLPSIVTYRDQLVVGDETETERKVGEMNSDISDLIQWCLTSAEQM